MSQFRCRDHHSEPVTARGTGCQHCHRDREFRDRGALLGCLPCERDPWCPFHGDSARRRRA
jgi:hypothetical protein